MKRDRRLSHYLRWLPLGLLLASAATQVLDDGHGLYSSHAPRGRVVLNRNQTKSREKFR